MGRKNDLSNILSKKVDHNQRKRHTQHHHYNANRGASGYSLPEASSDPVNQTEETQNNSIGIGTGFGNNSNTNNPSSAKLTIKMPLPMKIGITIVAVMVPLISLMLFVVLFGNEGQNAGNGLSFGGYYSSRCDEMTVIFVDKNNGYAVTGSQTYSMEDYIAGVVAAEIGGFKDKEVYKTFAVAARTFALRNASEDCAIEGSARRQAFKDITDRSTETANMIYEAVNETEGQVIMSNGELYPIQYDAFCYISKDSNYYTLAQKNQKIPTDWALNNIWSKAYLNCPCDLKDKSMTECWDGNTWKDGGHGRGMSQYGSYYLAKQQGYTYDQILEFYYGEEIQVSSSAFMTSIAGLEIKDTRKAKALNEPISTFLSSKGSSIDNLNNFIHESVKENGAGTREGVVTAAVALINYLYDNFNVRLPYYWGGRISSTSIPSTFGTYSPSAVSRGGNINYYKSFDCSGFASWAIRTGGYNFTNKTTSSIDSTFSKNSCNITQSTCVGQPGDLINSKSGHVELIIAVDEANQKYFIAHSGGPGVVMQERDMHKGNNSKNETKIIFMEEFYSDQSNINLNY